MLLFLQCDKIKELIAKLRETLGKKDDTDPEDLKKQTNELQQASLKLFEMAYKKVLMKINLINAIIILCMHLSECYLNMLVLLQMAAERESSQSQNQSQQESESGEKKEEKN